MSKPDFDIAVIGAGSGGLTVAAAAAQFGQRVVLFEKGEMGGDCLNYGCVPSKALIAAADHADVMKNSASFGFATVSPEINYARLKDHVRGVIDAIAPNDSVERFTALGVRVIKAEAKFIDRRTMEAGGQLIHARRFVIATGSKPAIPAIPGLDTIPYLTNETVFDLAKAPQHLLILGGGPIGVELAQAHARLGTRVTLVEAGQILSREDPEAAALLRRSLLRDGVTLHENAKVMRAETQGKTGTALVIATDAGEMTVAGSHLLVATGRTAHIESLDCPAAGISTDRSEEVV